MYLRLHGRVCRRNNDEVVELLAPVAAWPNADEADTRNGHSAKAILLISSSPSLAPVATPQYTEIGTDPGFERNLVHPPQMC
jgi:hypothetical protein